MVEVYWEEQALWGEVLKATHRNESFLMTRGEQSFGTNLWRVTKNLCMNSTDKLSFNVKDGERFYFGRASSWEGSLKQLFLTDDLN